MGPSLSLDRFLEVVYGHGLTIVRFIPGITPRVSILPLPPRQFLWLTMEVEITLATKQRLVTHSTTEQLSSIVG